MGWFEELVGGVVAFADPFSAGMRKNYEQGALGNINKFGRGIDNFIDPSDMVGINTKYFKEAFPELTDRVLETKEANQFGHAIAGIVGYAGAPWMAPIVSGLTDEITLDWKNMTPEEYDRAKNDKVVKGITTYLMSEAASYAGGSNTSAGGDALGGGLTGEGAQLAGAEYGYNAAGEGVGPIAQSGYPTGSEGANFYDPQEFGAIEGAPEELVSTTVNSETGQAYDVVGDNFAKDAAGNPMTEDQVRSSEAGWEKDATAKSQIEAQKSADPTWYEKAWNKSGDIAKQNVGKLGDIGKAISASGGELVAGGMTPSGGSSLYPWEEEARIRRLSSDPSKDKVTATNLELWKAGKLKATDYNAEVLARELANYKKKEEEQNVYI
jgi:hypothetical protein